MALENFIEQFKDDTENGMGNQLGSDSSLPALIIISIYLLITLILGPSFMKTRPAYALKTYIILYNICQVFACIYLVNKICVINLPTLQFWKCIYYNPQSIEGRDFAHICVFVFWLKISEMSETVVFVLRKKQRQVSALHVFHHCATVLLSHEFVRYQTNSAMCFPMFLNAIVHIIMYTYYLMAAVLPASIVAQLTPLKKAITTIQLVQFAMMFLQLVLVIILGCKLPFKMVMIFVIMLTAFSYMFYDFYKKNYTTKKQTVADKKIKSDLKKAATAKN